MADDTTIAELIGPVGQVVAAGFGGSGLDLLFSQREAQPLLLDIVALAYDPEIIAALAGGQKLAADHPARPAIEAVLADPKAAGVLAGIAKLARHAQERGQSLAEAAAVTLAISEAPKGRR